MAEEPDHRVEEQLKTIQSDISEKIVVETGPITPGTTYRRIQGASDQLNAALEAAQADCKQREVRTDEQCVITLSIAVENLVLTIGIHRCEPRKQ